MTSLIFVEYELVASIDRTEATMPITLHPSLSSTQRNFKDIITDWVFFINRLELIDVDGFFSGGGSNLTP